MTADVVSVLAAARAPISELERRRVCDAARAITALALVAALEHPDDERPVGWTARAFARDADAARLGALVEPLAPAHAHALVEALSRHGFVRSEQARLAHARIDAGEAGRGPRDNAPSPARGRAERRVRAVHGAPPRTLSTMGRAPRSRGIPAASAVV